MKLGETVTCYGLEGLSLCWSILSSRWRPVVLVGELDLKWACLPLGVLAAPTSVGGEARAPTCDGVMVASTSVCIIARARGLAWCFTFVLISPFPRYTWLGQRLAQGQRGCCHTAQLVLLSFVMVVSTPERIPLLPSVGRDAHADNGCLSLHQRRSQGPSWLRSPVCACSQAMVASAPLLVTLRCSLPALSAPSEPGAPPGSILPFSSSPRLQLLWATLPLFSLIPFVFLSKLTHNFYFTKDILSCFPILYIKKLFCNFGGMRWEWAIKTCTRCGIIM